MHSFIYCTCGLVRAIRMLQHYAIVCMNEKNSWIRNKRGTILHDFERHTPSNLQWLGSWKSQHPVCATVQIVENYNILLNSIIVAEIYSIIP